MFPHPCIATCSNAGLTQDEYQWFMEQKELRSHCIMGTDYYITNEHVIRNNGTAICCLQRCVRQLHVITRQNFDRYRMPVMHTETNRAGKNAEEWLWKEWMNLLRLREDGVPIVGFTWFGLVDMKDWDTALTQMNGTVNPVGLYTLQRKPRNWRSGLPKAGRRMYGRTCRSAAASSRC